MEHSHPTLEMYKLDLAELENIIKGTTRPNLKRQFEQYRLTLVQTQKEEERKIEKESHKPKTEQTEETVVPVVKTVQIEASTITKYAFDSGEKFAK